MDQAGGATIQRGDALDAGVRGGIDVDVGDGDEDLVQDSGPVQRFEDHCAALAVQVAHAEVGEETLVGLDEAARVDPLLAGDQHRDTAQEARARRGRHHDGRQPGGVEERNGEVQPAGLGVDDLEGKARPPLLRPESDQRLSELAADVIHGTDEIRLVPERLRPEGDGVGAGTEPAHEPDVGAPALALEALNSVISLTVITGAFALIFKLLPDVKIAWRDVWLGAAVTSLFFTGGKFLIGLYLGKSAVASAYGAAGSLVIIVVWVYYSAQILLLGAEFTKVWTKRRRSGFKVEKTATAVTAEARAEQGPGPKRKA